MELIIIASHVMRKLKEGFNMTRKEFIKKLEEVGFILSRYSHISWVYGDMEEAIQVYSNRDFFSAGEGKLYTFDELEQFLIERGIGEPKFRAWAYLWNRNYDCSEKDEGYEKYYKIGTDNLYSYRIGLNYDHDMVSIWLGINQVHFKGITPESCDKAIKLIEFLEQLDKE